MEKGNDGAANWGHGPPGDGKMTTMAAGRFEERVAAVIAALEPGEVVTYGEVAREAGYPGAARAVGNFLAKGGGELPWWRVVLASGRMATGKEADQAGRLAAEGVPVEGGRIAGFGRRH